MSRFLLAGTALATLFLAAAVPAASAHVVADPGLAQPGSYFRTALRVGHGCDGQATTAIRVQFPAGIVSASPQAKTGWQIAIERRKLEKPVAGAHGKMTDSEIGAISWSRGILPADQFDDFGLVMVIPQTPGAKLWLPVEQTCTDSTVHWDQIPAAGQSPHALPHPAALIQVADSSGTPMQMQMDHAQMDHSKMDHGSMDHSKMDMGAMKMDSGMSKDAAAAALAKPAATVGDIAIAAPFARATPVKVGGAFMLLKNGGKADDKLVKAASPVAEHVEIHEHVMEGGAMRMRPVDGVSVPAGGTAELQPGGYHVMLIGLKHPLKEGDHFPLTLTFEKAGTVTIQVPVLKPGATSAMPMGK
jgi:copper(I)-binding protein/uncharacterized protein YcnI